MSQITVIKYMGLFLALSLPSMALAVFRIIPENPVEGQMVQLYYNGCDPVVPNIATDELFYLEQDDNLINFIGSYGFGIPTCPIDFEYYYDLGIFPVGDYQLDIYDLLGTTPFPINTDEGNPSRSLFFGVSAPVPVPALSSLALMLLMFLVLSPVSLFLKQRIKV